LIHSHNDNEDHDDDDLGRRFGIGIALRSPSERPSVRPSTHPSLRQFGRLAVSHSSKSVTHIEIIIICISRSAQRDSVASASTYTSTRRVRHLAPHPRQIEGHKKSTHIAHCQSNISGTCTEKKKLEGGAGE